MARPINLHKNMTLRDVRRAAMRLGVVVTEHGSEIRFAHESWPRRFNVNGRRSSTTQILVAALRKLPNLEEE